MKLPSKLSLFALMSAAAMFAAAPTASAQDINFACSSASTVVDLVGYATNQCTETNNVWSVPASEDNQLLNYYSPDGIEVQASSGPANGVTYNENQGNTLPSLVPTISTASLETGEGCSYCGDSSGMSTLTVTDSNLFFTLNSLDLLAQQTALGYTIQGYDLTSPTPTLIYTISSTLGVSSDYTSIAGNSDEVQEVVITLDSGATGNDRIDNIDITVPEGGAALMFLLAGAACFATMRFKTTLPV